MQRQRQTLGPVLGAALGSGALLFLLGQGWPLPVRVVVWTLWAAAAGAVTFYAYLVDHLDQDTAARPLASDPWAAAALPFAAFALERGEGAIVVPGWWIEGPPDAPADRPAVVLSHGFAQDREIGGQPTYRLMAALHAAGYALATFDYPYGRRPRSHPVTAGREEREDLRAVVRMARERGAGFVAVLGYSLGAGTAMLLAAAGGEDPGHPDAIVLDSTFVASTAAFAEVLRYAMRLPRWVSRALVPPLFRLAAGVDFRDPPWSDLSCRFAVPALGLHGSGDAVAPPAAAAAVMRRQSHPLTRWLVVPGGGHVALDQAMGEDAYRDLVIGWLDDVRRNARQATAGPTSP